VSDLRERFPEDEVAFNGYKTTYTYFIDEVDNKLKVKQVDIVQLIATKSGSKMVWPIYYNDKIRLGDFDLRNEKNRKHSFEKFCSHQGGSGIFHSDAKICTYSFYVGASGTNLKLTSDIVFQDPRYFARVPFQEILPGKKRIIEFIWPKTVDVELKEFYLESTDISKEVISEGGNIMTRYEWMWPESLSSEENKPHFANYVPHIIPLTKSVTRDGVKTAIIGSTEDLYNWYQELAGGVDNESTEIPALIKSLTAGKSEREKLEAIYYWVQDNIKYIAFENGIMGFRPDNAGAVYEKKYGDCKGMANLLKTMLIQAGFDARLTWLGTSSLPYTYDIPSLAVDNHMVCTLITEEDEFVILDATAKYNQFSYSPFHIQGKQVLIEQGDEFRIETIPIESFENNYEKLISKAAIQGNEIVGEGTLILDGDAKQFFLIALSRIDKKDHPRFIRSVVSYHGLTDGITTDFEEVSRNDSVKILVKSRFQNKVQSFGEELYVDIEMRKEFSDLKIDKQRKAPFDFGRRRMVLNEIVFEIPDGYKVDNLPEPLNSIDEKLELIASFELLEGAIKYTKQLILKEAIIYPEDFKSWNASIEELNTFYNQPIILSKK
ncbi:MAG: transglutaminase-like domain-containing protein, partial [Cyclobacteriaceae bacterium]